MSERDLPQGTADAAPLSFDDGADAIADLLSPVTVDPGQEDESKEKAEADDAQEALEDDSDDEGADEDEASADDEDEDEESEDDDQEDAEGEFADENKFVTLADGRKLTVAELKDYASTRAADFQRDYTRKSEELAAKSKRVDETAQTLSQHRDFLLWAYQQIKPQPPDPSLIQSDFVAYTEQEAAYRAQERYWNQLQDGFKQFTRQETERSTLGQQERLAQEQARMFDLIPEFRNPAKLEEFKAEVAKVGTETYGFTPQELSGVADARMVAVLRDAISFRKLKNNAPRATEAIKGKPKMLKGKKSASPQDKNTRTRKARADQLAKSGDFDLGVEVLKDFVDL